MYTAERSVYRLLPSMVVAAFAALTIAMLAFPLGLESPVSFSDSPVAHLTATLGISTGAAATIWNAYNSWWATALTIALAPIGFGAWAATIRLTFDRLVKTLGKKGSAQSRPAILSGQ